MEKKFIDVKSVIKKKAKRWSFLFNPFAPWLKKLLHEDELNLLINKQKHLDGVEFGNAIIKDLNLQIQVEGAEKIPDSGHFVFVANHPLGGLDGLAFVKVVSDYYANIRFPVNDILLNIQNFESIFVPVNKFGSQPRAVVEQFDKEYASDNQILYFPAGLVSRRTKGKIEDLDWQKSFVAKAIKHKRDIIPVYIDGKNSDRFYRIANWRKRLKFRLFNVEMVFLPDELFRQRNANIKFIIGAPIPYTELTKEKSYFEWAQEIKRRVYALPEFETH